MSDPSEEHEIIHPGDTATVENVSDRPLNVTVAMAAGASITLEMKPKQTLEVSPGEARAEIILHDGDPSELLVVQPDQP